MPRIPKLNWANQYIKLPNQSNFHESVREIFCTHPFFKNLACYQEVPVQDLFPEYSGTARYDWYIEPLSLILELHGQQHYKATAFGSQSAQTTKKKFLDQQGRDELKKSLAEENNFIYKAIAYNFKLTPQTLLTYLLDIV